MKKNIFALIALFSFGSCQELLSSQKKTAAEIMEQYQQMGAAESDPAKKALNERNKREWKERDNSEKKANSDHWDRGGMLLDRRLCELTTIREKIVYS